MASLFTDGIRPAAIDAVESEPSRTVVIPRSFWFGACAYACVYFALDYLRFRNYDTGSDFGVYMQSVSDPSGLLRNVEGSHFISHFSPMYDLIMPLVIWSGSSCIPLLAFQAVSGAAAACGLLAIARHLVGPSLAIRIATLAFFYPPLAGVIFGDPNENFLAPAATVWLFAFVLARKWMLAGCMVILALAVKEDQAAFLAWDGLAAAVWAYRTGDRALVRFAVAVVVTACSVFAIYLFAIRPAAGGHDWIALDRAIAAAPTDSSHGGSFFARFGYILEILVPLAFLPLAGWRLLIFAAPALAEVLLSRNSAVWSMGQHYAGAWIGYIFVATAFGVAELAKRSTSIASRFLTAALILSIANLTFASPTHWRIHLHAMSAHDHALDEVLADLPRNATLGTHDEVYAHLWRLPKLRYELADSPHYALVDTTMRNSTSARTMQREIRDGAYGNYRILWEKHGVRLYVRD